MNTNKYADLPDIVESPFSQRRGPKIDKILFKDTAPDVYETEDSFPSSNAANIDDEDDDSFSRPSGKTRQETSGKEELDMSHLMSAEDASRKFRKAEKKRDRIRAVYAYPNSPDGPSSPVDDVPKALPLSQRLRALQAELASLESELADPTNPLIQREREEMNVDPGELIRGLVDVRSRLDKIVREKEGRARLVDNLVHAGRVKGDSDTSKHATNEKERAESPPAKPNPQSLVDVDKRVEELEKLVGASNASLDESSPLPPPLLPLVTKLNSQLALLTQPRHLDSISRRLKLLLSDLDRASVAQQQHRRQGSQGSASNVATTATTHEQLLTIVNRIAPSLPQIPHILTRLRTLSTLHSAAGEFQDTLKDLEQEQRKVHAALQELQKAVETVEASLESNRDVVKGNVQGLDGRVNDLLKRLEDVKRESQLQTV